jgi:hypothetical protein
MSLQFTGKPFPIFKLLPEVPTVNLKQRTPGIVDSGRRGGVGGEGSARGQQRPRSYVWAVIARSEEE